MLNGRRAQPIPLDFEYALYKFDLPLASLTPHLKPPIPVSKTQIKLEALPAETEGMKEQEDKVVIKLLGEELDGEVERLETPWIPKKFIPFPSKHTYKWTEPEAPPQKDRRKIREEAAKVSRQAEEALRRFVAETGTKKDLKTAASKDPKTKQTHELWEKVMVSLKPSPLNDTDEKNNAEGKNSLDDQSMIVNSESQYFRKGVPKKKGMVSLIF